MPNYLLPLLTTVARYAKAMFVKKTRDTEAVQKHFLLKLLQNHQDEVVLL